MDITLQDHWNAIYSTKNPDQVSWTQDYPKTSLDFIHALGLPKTANIIDVGGGNSKLVDYLLEAGYQNVTVLDISATALDKAKERLGKLAGKVKWVVSDIANYKTDTTFDVWHDRAAFHFLTSDSQVENYLNLVRKSVTGYVIMGTFSDRGPEKCSGLPVKRYTEEKLTDEFKEGFVKLKCITEDHLTPFNTAQNFLFCSFRRQG